MKLKTIGLIITLLLAVLSVPLASEAQRPAKLPRIGYLSPGSSEPSPTLVAFRQGLGELGYTEGRNIAIEYRWAEGGLDRLPDLAAELVRLKVDVIVAWGPAIRVAKETTRIIPIVMASTLDAVATGLVASLARPGGNVTGLTLISTELMGKRLELLREVLPNTSRLALLTAPGPAIALLKKETENAARSLGFRLQPVEVRDAEEVDSAFRTMVKGRAGALYVVESPVLHAHGRRILELAAKNRLPTFSGVRAFVEAGG